MVNNSAEIDAPPLRQLRLPWVCKPALVLGGLCLLVRLAPNLAPIRPKDIPQQDLALTVQDRNGLELGTLLSRDQTHTAVVPLAEVSPHFVQAILAAEDGRYYDHGPVDLKAVARALWDNWRARRVVSGASTITMQLARMLQPNSGTVAGKASEVWLAWRLAAGMDRNQILEAYVNRLPMGSNIYGVEAAAQVYFGVPAKDLNLAQATLLAALPNDPTNLNPYSNWSGLKRRQAYVLAQMVQDGYLTAEQAKRVIQEPVTLQPRNQGIQAAPHFLFWVASQLPAQHPATIQTTLDLPLQQFVEGQVRLVVRSLQSHNGHQAAALVLDNHTGAVLAYVGSPDYFNRLQAGENDGVQALRQPGSALKPFLYALALEQRQIRPNTVLADVPTHYAIPGAQIYSPQDYSESFQGPVRVRLALANSLNIPAVRVLERVGVSTFLEQLRQLGFSHLNRPADYYGLGLALGSGEVSLWELARAYQTLANQGQTLPLRLLQSGATAVPPVLSAETIGSASTWALITDMLSDPHARARAFGVASVLQLPFPAAVKTGTSSNYRDTWTVGYTRDYTVATWVGNFNGEPMRKISGVTGAAPLWNRIMLHLHERRQPQPFLTPAQMVRKPICALSGLKPTPVCPTVVEEYFAQTDLAEYEQHLDTVFQAEFQAANSSGVKYPQSKYRLNLPREYDEWLSRQENLPGQVAGLKIAFPRNNDYFLVPDPNRNPAPPPKLELKLTGTPTQPVVWRLNGKTIANQTSASLFYPLLPGNYVLQVQQGNQSDTVQFEVRAAEPNVQRRGFSISKQKP